MKKKTIGKKAATRKNTPKKAVKKRTPKRSQMMNEMVEAPSMPYDISECTVKKTICANVKCKLRSAGCYGHEHCPGFKSKGR